MTPPAVPPDSDPPGPAPARPGGGWRGLVGPVAVTLVLAVAALGGVEWWLRSTQTRVVPAPGATMRHNAFDLVRYTPHGRRLVAGADVLIRNHYLSHRDVPMHINSHGFRDRELAVPKPPDELRILVLGDSITWGDYLPADEVYVERAQHYLDRRIEDRRVEMVNAGVGDTGLREELDLLVERGLAVEPDVVVVGFYLNDSRPPWGFPAERGSRGWLRRHSVLADKLYDALLLRRWIHEKGEERFSWIPARRRLDWQHRPEAFLELARLARYDWGAAWLPETWAELDPMFGELATLADEHGFRAAVAFFPVAFQVRADFVEDTPQRELAARARAHGLPTLDLLPALRQHADEKLFFDHCHPTPAGNEVVGAALARFLAEDVLADDAPAAARAQ